MAYHVGRYIVYNEQGTKRFFDTALGGFVLDRANMCCPKCRSKSFSLESTLTGDPEMRWHVCTDCGHRWTHAIGPGSHPELFPEYHQTGDSTEVLMPSPKGAPVFLKGGVKMFENTDAWRAELDQAMAGMSTMAAMLAKYHKSLVEEGFSKGEALSIIIGFQAAMLAKSGQKGD